MKALSRLAARLGLDFVGHRARTETSLPRYPHSVFDEAVHAQLGPYAETLLLSQLGGKVQKAFEQRKSQGLPPPTLSELLAL
jgi:hypothetical protein